MNGPLTFTVVEVHTSPWEAHVSRALLESEGIPAILASEHHVWASWPSSLMLGGVRVLVPTQHVAPARSVMAMRDNGELQAALAVQFPPVPSGCPRCGSAEFVERRDWSSVALSIALLFVGQTIFPPTKDRRCRSCAALAPDGL